MNRKVFKTLEFDKILQRLCEYSENEKVKERILALEPKTELGEVCELLAETTEAVGVILRRGNPPGFKITDVVSALMRAQRGGMMNQKELLGVSRLLKTTRRIKGYILDDKALEDGVVFTLAAALEPLKPVETRIDEAILSEDEIADAASSELYQIRRKMKNLEGKIRETLNGIITSAHYQKALQDAIITMRGERFVVPVKAEHKAEIKGIVHDSSSSGATLFIEPMAVVSLSNELADLSGKEKEEIDRILAELTAYVSEYREPIITNTNALYELDFIFCKAKLSISQNAVAPELNEDGIIYIKRGRHPLLDPEKVVPVDIWLGDAFDTLVITGPNTGGKTVSLKTLGLFTIMAQSGLHISVSDESKIAVFDEVFADIGDEQSIEQSLSTFSSHIVNLVGILKRVTDKSLVLADELGAGTDPTEGAALAIAILEYIRARGARAAATTHYSELKMYALSTNGVENASCEFDVKTLSPTYKLLIGVPGKSNAFAISKRLGIDVSIIQRAKELVSDESLKLEDVISGLESSRQRAEREKERAESMARAAQSMRDKAGREAEEMEQKRAKLLQEARTEAMRIIESAKEESQKIIREIRAIRDSAPIKDAMQQAEQARAALREQSEKLQDRNGGVKNQNRKPLKNVKPGDLVIIVSLDQQATVLSMPDKSGKVQVQAGIMKMKIPLTDLAADKEQTKEQNKTISTHRVASGKVKTAKTEIDVRGMMLEEALLVVDKYLDEAIMSSLHTVTIIHGKGTGVLRSGIGEYLKRHPLVSEYRAGRYGEGEMGVTVVTFK
ncbi:MAG: endonuclease MutS2 [Clostridia bacterium]|nr:endonuclease MutS2 [Clostridia bacterium]